MSMEYKITVRENGRMFLPLEIRKYLEVSPGDQIVLVLDQELKIVPFRNNVKAIQEFIKSKNPNNISLVDSLKETRTFEAKGE